MSNLTQQPSTTPCTHPFLTIPLPRLSRPGVNALPTRPPLRWTRFCRRSETPIKFAQEVGVVHRRQRGGNLPTSTPQLVLPLVPDVAVDAGLLINMVTDAIPSVVKSPSIRMAASELSPFLLSVTSVRLITFHGHLQTHDVEEASHPLARNPSSVPSCWRCCILMPFL